MERQGIREMMDKQRYRPTHLQEAMISKNVPGNWSGRSGLQNVYNLIEGRVMPKDAYVFVFLSEFLNERLRDILMRYTRKEQEVIIHDGQEINW
jgi:hypothetical protein